MSRSRLRDSLLQLRRTVVWHRRLLATLAAMACMLSLVSVLRPSPPRTQLVVVAARSLPGGARLSRQDLREVPYPRALAPEQPAPLGELVGRTLVAPLPAGTQLTRLSILNPTAAGRGRVLTAVRFPDADVARLLAPGTVIDIIASGAQDAGVVAHRARVVTLPHADAAGGGLMASDNRGLLVMVEVTEKEASGLARASAEGHLSFSLQP